MLHVQTKFCQKDKFWNENPTVSCLSPAGRHCGLNPNCWPFNSTRNTFCKHNRIIRIWFDEIQYYATICHIRCDVIATLQCVDSNRGVKNEVVLQVFWKWNRLTGKFVLRSWWYDSIGANKTVNVYWNDRIIQKATDKHISMHQHQWRLVTAAAIVLTGVLPCILHANKG